MRKLLCLASAVLFAGSMGSAPAAEPAPAAAAPPLAPVDYSKDSSWLCRPGREENCLADYTTTIVSANGQMKIEKWQPAADPKIDCFYVYPTVSADDQPNSDLVPATDAEIAMTRQQVGRFASVCRLFVPMYRQVTIWVMRGKFKTGDWEMAYNDVKAAWADYLARDNHGRGVVLIGHSQGANILQVLVQNEIDGKPSEANVLSAMIVGGAVRVPEGKDVGGDFKSFPLCRSPGQLHCAITYSSFRDTAPPTEKTHFGKPENGLVVGCTNPAALGGGSGALKAYMPADFNTPPYQNQPGQTPQPDWVKGKKVAAPYVSVPGLVSAECRHNQFATYLGIAVHGNPNDPRVDDIEGDVRIPGADLGEWGLHPDDMLLPQGNLIDIVKAETKAFEAQQTKPDRNPL